MEKINNVDDARKHFEKWCSQFQRNPLDVDDIDGKYLSITFQKNTMLYFNELESLMSPFRVSAVRAYYSYQEVILFYNAHSND